MNRQLLGEGPVRSFRGKAAMMGAAAGAMTTPIELHGESEMPLSPPPPASLDGGVGSGLVLQG